MRNGDFALASMAKVARERLSSEEVDVKAFTVLATLGVIAALGARSDQSRAGKDRRRRCPDTTWRHGRRSCRRRLRPAPQHLHPAGERQSLNQSEHPAPVDRLGEVRAAESRDSPPTTWGCCYVGVQVVGRGVTGCASAREWPSRTGGRRNLVRETFGREKPDECRPCSAGQPQRDRM